MNESREMVRFLRSCGADKVTDEVGDRSEEGNLPIEVFEAAINNAQPGDTIMVRGGVYSCPRAIAINRSGEPGKPIYLMAAPGEVPVFDFSGTPGNTFFVTGSYWRLKGLVITGGERALELSGGEAHHNTLEQIRLHGGEALAVYINDDAGYNIVLNCDAHHYFSMMRNGDGGDGIGVANNAGQGNVLIGNRAWNNADDGIDLWYAMRTVRVERCYSFYNGVNIWDFPFWLGNGNGFKLGAGEGRHVLVNCFAWGHKWGAGAGFTLNGNTSGLILHNCSAWDNRINFQFASNYWRSIGVAQEDCVLVNNASLDGRSKDTIDKRAESQCNSWDAALCVQVTDRDFVSLDDSAMTAPRNLDGSIPYNNFLRLAPRSAAIDKGTDVGMPFRGARPDLGAFEHDPNEDGSCYVKMLHQAVRDHDIKKINKLIAAGEGINDKDWLGYTPLRWAVYFGYPDLIELLISKGADPDIQSDTVRYALEIARAMAYPELEALLCKLGATAGDTSAN
ncbi:MAG: right-handed parallel beta-helix repeat-containing protein [Phycisphaerae bacterium]|nr:right-handed parallel beta-helix repeat-containing protein [Phycisphaerae bacterium]